MCVFLCMCVCVESVCVCVCVEFVCMCACVHVCMCYMCLCMGEEEGVCDKNKRGKNRCWSPTSHGQLFIPTLWASAVAHAQWCQNLMPANAPCVALWMNLTWPSISTETTFQVTTPGKLLTFSQLSDCHGPLLFQSRFMPFACVLTFVCVFVAPRAGPKSLNFQLSCVRMRTLHGVYLQSARLKAVMAGHCHEGGGGGGHSHGHSHGHDHHHASDPAVKFR